MEHAYMRARPRTRERERTRELIYRSLNSTSPVELHGTSKLEWVLEVESTLPEFSVNTVSSCAAFCVPVTSILWRIGASLFGNTYEKLSDAMLFDHSMDILMVNHVIYSMQIWYIYISETTIRYSLLYSLTPRCVYAIHMCVGKHIVRVKYNTNMHSIITISYFISYELIW